MKIIHMKLIQRHIGKTVINAMLVVLLILAGINFFLNCLNEIDIIGRGDYNIVQALKVACLSLPQSVYQLFPIVGLLGCLLGLGALASNSELIAMRANGLSMLQIAWAVLKAAFVIVIVVTVLGELVAPFALHRAEKIRANALSSGQAISTPYGYWFRDGNSFIHVDSVVSKYHLSGISWYHFDDNFRMLESGKAKTGLYQQQHWTLQDVKTSTFNPNNQQITNNQYNDLMWDISLRPDWLALVKATADEMPIWQLFNYIAYRQHNGLQTNSERLVFWQRLIQPLVMLVMLLLALPFIFGPLRNVTMGLRIVVGVAIGFAFYFANQLFGPFSMVYQFPPFLAAVIPVFLMGFLGMMMLRFAR